MAGNQAQVLTMTTNMDREQWLEERKKGIGGSDVGAILGLNKYRSKMQVYLEKIGAIIPDEPGEAAYWGTVLEDLVAQEFKKRTGLKIRRRNALLQHPKYPFMLANLDRIIVDKEKGNGILEVKTANQYLEKEWEGDKVPDSYLVQIQHYFAVTGYKYGYFVVLIGGQKYHHIYVERDEELIQSLIEIESDFWNLVQHRIPPEIDGSESTSNVLDFLYPAEQTSKEAIQLDDSVLSLIEQYKAAQEAEAQAKLEKEEAANRMKEKLGPFESAFVQNFEISWKPVQSSRLDTKRLKVENPAVYQTFLKESSSRRFTIKQNN